MIGRFLHRYPFAQPGGSEVVYFLMYTDEVVYIGCTTRLGRRLDEHAGLGGGRKVWDDVWFLIPKRDAKHVESTLIELYKPRYNLDYEFNKPGSVRAIKIQATRLAEMLRYIRTPCLGQGVVEL